MSSTTMPPLEFCKAPKCHAPLFLLRYPKTGNSAPIEAKASDDGNILINPEDGTYRIIPVSERAQYAGQLHKNHYATCPAARAFHDYAKGGKR